MDVSEGAIRVLGGLLAARTGQKLAPERNWRIEAALRPMLAARGLGSCDALIGELARGADPGLADELVDALVNNETYFFRDRQAFTDLLSAELDRIARHKAERRRLRVWSAGCSTGQEAYSVAMTFAEQPERWRGWSIDIVGTDISDGAVARAREAEYSQFEIQRGLKASEMLRWFEKRGERWRLDQRIGAMAKFRAHNLLDPAPSGFFDIVLCRNVMLYFPPATRSRVFDRLADAIDPAGGLMLGAGETILGNTTRFEADDASRGLYRRAAPAFEVKAAAAR